MTRNLLPASTVDHRPGCRTYEVGQFVGKRGDLMARCNDCGAIKVLEAAARPEPELEPVVAAEPPKVLLSRYRCREHLDQEVNWRGKGCPRCDHPRRKRPRTEPEAEVAL